MIRLDKGMEVNSDCQIIAGKTEEAVTFEKHATIGRALRGHEECFG